MNKIYTIGHSTHKIERFLELLFMHNITAVCDVRSSPYSRFNPQYNKEYLQTELKSKNIKYVYIGKELGPRSDDSSCYIDGKVQYNKLSKTEIFKKGLERLKKGIESYQVTLLCAEKDPIMCHRMILICRHLKAENVEINHIIENGELEKNQDAEKRLMEFLNIPEQTLFENNSDLLENAYDIQGDSIAYTKDTLKD